MNLRMSLSCFFLQEETSEMEDKEWDEGKGRVKEILVAKQMQGVQTRQSDLSVAVHFTHLPFHTTVIMII